MEKELFLNGGESGDHLSYYTQQMLRSQCCSVEALKDQGFCRWNYTIRSLHQHAKNNIRSVSQSSKNLLLHLLLWFSEASNTRNCNNVSKGSDANKLKQAEESLRTVMYLSCWGPN
ncbi:uncharacterized protein LOC116107145 [Pistacia vera]|uniref:uncharacterized protein LOC116107145 n=1 Tax=Pistacia vera TaxID=55513 RepID=UPI0012637113|nr:uncharacterized protein LOC116107145 [Pistacia vera]